MEGVMILRKLITRSVIAASILSFTSWNDGNAAPPAVSTPAPPGNIEVQVIGAPTGDKDSEAVIAALQKLLHGMEKRDITVISECLSPRVIMIDDRTSNIVFGREPVLEHIKTNVIGSKSSSPVKSITVYNPFVRVKNDTAMVSFRATKTMADVPSTKLESWCSEVFERQDGNWSVLQFRSKWRPITAKE
jgi:hypothetical protein